MPEHVVAGPISEGKLVPLMIEDDASPRDALTIYAAHRHDRVLGQAGRWLLATLQDRLSAELTGGLD